MADWWVIVSIRNRLSSTSRLFGTASSDPASLNVGDIVDAIPGSVPLGERARTLFAVFYVTGAPDNLRGLLRRSKVTDGPLGEITEIRQVLTLRDAAWLESKSIASASMLRDLYDAKKEVARKNIPVVPWEVFKAAIWNKELSKEHPFTEARLG